jgi:hypothetical protein
VEELHEPIYARLWWSLHDVHWLRWRYVCSCGDSAGASFRRRPLTRLYLAHLEALD